MSNNRRVGTLTLGIVLILMGGTFISRLIFPEHSLRILLDFWPVVLIILGIETLTSYFLNKEERLKYDGWSIFIMLCLIGFSTLMGGAQFILEEFPQFSTHIGMIGF